MSGKNATFASYNLNQNRQGAWAYLSTLVGAYAVDAALVQEASLPAALPESWRCHPSPAVTERWRISVPQYYRTGAAT